MARIRAYEETLKLFILKAYKTKINKKRRPYDIAISALGKQIPMRVSIDSDGVFKAARCQKCRGIIGAWYSDYCCDCGQRLDWSKDNE